MIHQSRIQRLNDKPVRKGRYVLYWMQAAQRTEYNHALEYAIRRANESSIPVVVVFGLTDDYPEANLRHYLFMLQGLQEVAASLLDRGMRFVVRRQSPVDAATELAEEASRVVVDGGQLRIQRQWRKQTADNLKCPLEQVETNLIVPVEIVSQKEEFSAGTFRPRIHSHLTEYLKPLRSAKPKRDSLGLKFDQFDISSLNAALESLDIDRTVQPAPAFHGGTKQAKRTLRHFIAHKLDGFDDYRNNPGKDYLSNMSPYLHFGQVSPLYIALEVMKSDSPGHDSYLEELIVRRELSHNFVYYNPLYDRYASLPQWAQNTLRAHRRDPRQPVYSLTQFEQSETHDTYWNAAQNEMVLAGKMHGYMRMYWGKKIIEWSQTPQKAFRTALYLNNKYELDGRDANGYTGVAWCFGKHDRAWAQRDVFGKIRYMNAAGLKRKFDPDAYVEMVQAMQTVAT